MATIESTPRPYHPTGVSGFLIEAVYFLILIVTVGGWTVVGFCVWVPLLIRTTTILAAAVFYATLFQDQDRVTNAERGLNLAVRFYLRGFDHFITFYRHRHDVERPGGVFGRLSDMKWKELLVECLWVVGVWSVLYLASHTLLAYVSTFLNR